MTEGQEDESGDDDDDDAEYGEEETLTTAHVNNRSVSESTDATAPATTPLLPNDADFRSSSKPAAAATPENPDDKSPNRKSSLTVGVCSGEEEKVAVSEAASGHGAICSTLRNVSPAEVKVRAVQKCNEINFVFS